MKSNDPHGTRLAFLHGEAMGPQQTRNKTMAPRALSASPIRTLQVATDDVGRYLRMRELLGLLGVSRVTLWDWRRRGLFPAPHRLGPNTIAWTLEDVRAWQSSRPRA